MGSGAWPRIGQWAQYSFTGATHEGLLNIEDLVLAFAPLVGYELQVDGILWCTTTCSRHPS